MNCLFFAYSILKTDYASLNTDGPKRRNRINVPLYFSWKQALFTWCPVWILWKTMRSKVIFMEWLISN